MGFGARTEVVKSDGERVDGDRRLAAVVDEAELHVGLMVRLDVDLGELAEDPVLRCAVPVGLVSFFDVVQVLAVAARLEDRDHHVDLRPVVEFADVQEL